MPPRSKKPILSDGPTINDVYERIIDLDKKVDLHIQKTEFGFKALQDLDAQQNSILQEHHDRSVQLKRDNELREEALKLEIEKVSRRVDRLEFFVKAFEFFKKHAIWLAGLGTAIAMAWSKIKGLF